MIDLIREDMSFYIDEVEKSVDELYDNELNFNNADTTSGQRCYSRAEIKNLYIKHLIACLNDEVIL